MSLQLSATDIDSIGTVVDVLRDEAERADLSPIVQRRWSDLYAIIGHDIAHRMADDLTCDLESIAAVRAVLAEQENVTPALSARWAGWDDALARLEDRLRAKAEPPVT